MMKHVSHLALAVLIALPSLSQAQSLGDLSFSTLRGGKTGGKPTTGGDGSTGGSTATLQSWMNPELQGAWDSGFLGGGTKITVIDDFNSGKTFSGDLGIGAQSLTHGQWTFEQAGFVAPEASLARQDFSSGQGVRLKRGALNVLNLSYGMMGAAGYDVNAINWSAQEASIVSYAQTGKAVISKAAGNDAVAMGGVTSKGTQDYLSMDLIGAQSAIFVGALSKNGTTGTPATLASYSNFAGNNPIVQDQFLVVGVEGNKTGLYGTSFAAPIVSGYAAIVGSKFTNATPTQISHQLLDTARTDTILNYQASVHGQGEASIARALAPVSIK